MNDYPGSMADDLKTECPVCKKKGYRPRKMYPIDQQACDKCRDTFEAKVWLADELPHTFMKKEKL